MSFFLCYGRIPVEWVVFSDVVRNRTKINPHTKYPIDIVKEEAEARLAVLFHQYSISFV